MAKRKKHKIQESDKTILMWCAFLHQMILSLISILESEKNAEIPERVLGQLEEFVEDMKTAPGFDQAQLLALQRHLDGFRDKVEKLRE